MLCVGQLSRSFHLRAAGEGMEAGKQKTDGDPGEQAVKHMMHLGHKVTVLTQCTLGSQ